MSRDLYVIIGYPYTCLSNHNLKYWRLIPIYVHIRHISQLLFTDVPLSGDIFTFVVSYLMLDVWKQLPW